MEYVPLAGPKRRKYDALREVSPGAKSHAALTRSKGMAILPGYGAVARLSIELDFSQHCLWLRGRSRRNNFGGAWTLQQRQSSFILGRRANAFAWD